MEYMFGGVDGIMIYLLPEKVKTQIRTLAGKIKALPNLMLFLKDFI